MGMYIVQVTLYHVFISISYFNTKLIFITAQNFLRLTIYITYNLREDNNMTFGAENSQNKSHITIINQNFTLISLTSIVILHQV